MSQMSSSTAEFCCRLPYFSASSGTWTVLYVTSFPIMWLSVGTAMHIRLLLSDLNKPLKFQVSLYLRVNKILLKLNVLGIV
jgi:hypothetical protein